MTFSLQNIILKPVNSITVHVPQKAISAISTDILETITTLINPLKWWVFQDQLHELLQKIQNNPHIPQNFSSQNIDKIYIFKWNFLFKSLSWIKSKQ